MKVVKAANILYYYDGPQVIEARDTIGGHYIAVMVAPEEKHDRYLVAGLGPERLRQFRSGMLDLRTLLAESDTEEWFIGSAPAGPDQLMALQVQHTSLVHSELLPDGGFVLHDRPTDDLALNEARARNNLVLEVTTDPPEAIQGHRNPSKFAHRTVESLSIDGRPCLSGGFPRSVSYNSGQHRFGTCSYDGCGNPCCRGFISCCARGVPGTGPVWHWRTSACFTTSRYALRAYG